MSAQHFLAEIKQVWLHRVAHLMARGAGVRENFMQELAKFYELLDQSIVTGDPSWMDSVIYEWVNAPTQSDLEEGQNHISNLLYKMVETTFEVSREVLKPEQALELLSVLNPVFSHALQKAARFETELRIAYISQELVSVQEKLEKLDRSKSNFIAVAAHELKTPLTLIEGYAAMIEGIVSKKEESIQNLIHGVHNGIRRLREIVDDMIDVSLIDNQLMQLNFQPLWLNRTLSLLAKEVKNSVAERKQILTINEFPGTQEVLYADQERIYQALKNLLTNAIKYTPDGGSITIDGRTLPGFVEVTFADTGIGISPENQQTIFEKFGQLGSVQLHSSGKTKFKGGGPGLGLAITKGIIEAHGGAIWVESDGYDEVKLPGTTFHVLIPIRTQSADPKLAKLFNSKIDGNNSESKN